MQLHEKIKEIRTDLGLSIQDVHRRGIEIFGTKKFLSYRTLQRIETGYISKFSSVLKICCALGIVLEKLVKGTNLEQRFIIRKNQRIDEYTYNKKVHASVIVSPNRSFLAVEMTLQPFGKTTIEQSPTDGKIFEKWIYIVEGQLTCIVGEEKFILDRKDSISFDSTIAHHFENNSKKKCICTVVQNPKHF